MSENDKTIEAGNELSAHAQDLEDGMTLAKRFPRKYSEVRKLAVEMCRRPSFALKPDGKKRAIYDLEDVGGHGSGPSVIMARALAQCWGNMFVVACQILGDRKNEDGVELRHIRSMVWDLERNVGRSQEDSFLKLIQRKRKSDNKTVWVTTDENDLRDLTKRRASLLERNCILALLPDDLVEECTGNVMDVVAGNDVRAAKLQQMLASFKALVPPVPTSMLEDYLQHNIRDTSLEEIEVLGKIWKQIKDGKETAENALAPLQGISDAVDPPNLGTTDPQQDPERTPTPDDDPVKTDEDGVVDLTDNATFLPIIKAVLRRTEGGSKELCERMKLKEHTLERIPKGRRQEAMDEAAIMEREKLGQGTIV